MYYIFKNSTAAAKTVTEEGFLEALLHSTDTVFAVSRPEAAVKTMTE